MIAYEDLCLALDRHNRRLRGEVVPEPPPMGRAAPADDDFDIMEEADAAPPAELGADYSQGAPDVTAETELPEGGYDPAYAQQQGYDPAYAQQQGYDPAYAQQQGYDQNAYPQDGPPAVPGSGPVPGPGTPYPDGHDPHRQ
jgi:hypothetical protein